MWVVIIRAPVSSVFPFPEEAFLLLLRPSATPDTLLFSTDGVPSRDSSRNPEKYFSTRSSSEAYAIRETSGLSWNKKKWKYQARGELKKEQGGKRGTSAAFPLNLAWPGSVEVLTHNQFMKHREATVLAACASKDEGKEKREGEKSWNASGIFIYRRHDAVV